VSKISVSAISTFDARSIFINGRDTNRSTEKSLLAVLQHEMALNLVRWILKGKYAKLTKFNYYFNEE
jgi:hypothetical protein